jgi:hypothetical protein
MRTLLLAIIRRAGLKAWSKPFHNMRISRQTELAGEFPVHVVCEWLGNSNLIAQEHYLRVTDDDFRRAITGTSEKAAQNPARQTPASGRIAAQGQIGENAESSETLEFTANPSDARRSAIVAIGR